MNAFRLTGDIIHVMGLYILLVRLVGQHNAQGISRKTQELYLVVFLTRYLDLITSFSSIYNTAMKVLFIDVTAYIICILSPVSGNPVVETYRSDQDSIDHWDTLALPCFVLAFMTSVVTDVFEEVNIPALMEFLWTFSICLEAVACIPQILLYRRYQQVENISGGSFIFLMALYRAFYGLNWIYRAQTDADYQHHYLVYICGLSQVLIGCWGLFWPTGHVSAPISPQIKNLCQDAFCCFGNSSSKSRSLSLESSKKLEEPVEPAILIV